MTRVRELALVLSVVLPAASCLPKEANPLTVVDQRHFMLCATEPMNGLKDNWIPGPGDLAFAKPIEGGEPRIVWSVPGAPKAGPRGAGIVGVKGPSSRHSWTHTGATAGGYLGASIAILEDLDGDGFPDLACGAPGIARQYELPEPGGGRIVLLSGRSGEILRELRSPADVLQFGTVLRPIGDLDGDSLADFLTGSPQLSWSAHASYGVERKARGYVAAYSSKTGKELVRLSGPAGIHFGMAIDSIDDMNGDGIPEIVVGAPGFNATGAGPHEGKVGIYSGKTAALIREFVGPEPSSGFGAELMSVDDLDRDGLADIVVLEGYGRDYENEPLESRRGVARFSAISSGTGETLASLTVPSRVDSQGLVDVQFDLVPDQDGDGIRELAVFYSAPSDDCGYSTGAECCLFSLVEGRRLFTHFFGCCAPPWTFSGGAAVVEGRLGGVLLGMMCLDDSSGAYTMQAVVVGRAR